MVSGCGRKIGFRCLVTADSAPSLVGIAVIFRWLGSADDIKRSLVNIIAAC